MVFVGRVDELAALREPNWRDRAQLIVVHGRRRVGKTALVEEAYRDQNLWRFDGLEGASKQRQLDHFLMQLSMATGDPPTAPGRLDWSDALELLSKALEHRADQSIVVFLDELQWMARMRTPLISLFKSFWDTRLSRSPRHRFVLCGSISSFMVKRVIRSKALYGRISTEINLQPLSLADTLAFFEGRRSPEEVLQIAMCLGCIPQYLKELNPRLSLMQNLNEYAFKPSGYYFGELARLFISHFGKNPAYEKIIKALSAGPKTAPMLAAACGTRTGGRFSELLADLELAGFIERYPSLDMGPRSRHVRYRLLDELLHFHYRFLDSAQQEIRSGRFELGRLLPGQSWRQWEGYAFERLCRRSAGQIADRLRFSGIQYKAGSWFELPAKDLQGAQIDLLFERADRMLTLCEAKHTDRLQGAQLVREVEHKCQALRQRYPKHGIQKVLVLGRAVPIPQVVEHYFDEILSAPEDLF